MQLTRGITIFPVRRDKRCNSDGRRVSEELRNLCNAADVLVAVRLAEAEIFVQAETNIVAVQSVGVHFSVAEELVL